MPNEAYVAAQYGGRAWVRADTEGKVLDSLEAVRHTSLGVALPVLGITAEPATTQAGPTPPPNKVGPYTLTRTVSEHLNDVVRRGDFRGELSRPYLTSPLTIQEIIASGKPIPDPGGFPGALRWDVPGAFRDSEGTWELVIDPKTNRILHYNFRTQQ